MVRCRSLAQRQRTPDRRPATGRLVQPRGLVLRSDAQDEVAPGIMCELEQAQAAPSPPPG